MAKSECESPPTHLYLFNEVSAVSAEGLDESRVQPTILMRLGSCEHLNCHHPAMMP
jgi:hypothetical protein